ncbi:histone deacetylase family protein, partial [Alishewanella sp. SMS9]|nr:histone deacetylase family protein [Alishewanella sp. SMS9]
MAITIFSHPSCYYHDNGVEHPECGERLSAINDQIIRSGMEYVVMQFDATPASRESLYLA